MTERIVLTPDDAAAIARLIDEHAEEIDDTAQRIAADLVAEKLMLSTAFGRVVIVLDVP